MAKQKLKKSVKTTIKVIIILIFLTIAGVIGYNKYNEYLYHQTYEYKLLEIGYNKDEVSTILNNFNDSNDLDFFLNQEKNDKYINILKEKYYLKKNFYKYIEYMKSNKNMELATVIRNINIHLDNDFYKTNYNTDSSLGTSMLVNKYYLLDSTYEPSDLVGFGQEYAWGESYSKKCSRIAYDAFVNMWQAGRDAGFYFMVNSAYRSYQEQVTLYNKYKEQKGEKYADSIAARPGSSEHQTGLSLDIFSKDATTRETFKNSSAFQWLKNNAHHYGFIIRYPENLDKVTGYQYEAWHYRYVGESIATYIYENNITFEEYYAYFIEK